MPPKIYTPEAPTPSPGLCTEVNSGSLGSLIRSNALLSLGESKLEEALAEVLPPVETDPVPIAD